MKKIKFANVFILLFVGSLISVMFFSVIAAAVHITTHPISTLVDFMSDYYNVEYTIETDIYTLSEAYFDKNENVSDIIKKEYKEIEGIPAYYVAIPFLIYRCDEVSVSDVRETVKFFNQSFQENYDEEQLINFIFSSDIFSERKKEKNYTIDVIYEFFNIVKNSEEGKKYYTEGNSEIGNNIANMALTRYGCRYWWGAPGGGYGDGQKLISKNAKYFDCSGLVAWAHKNAGVNIARLTASAYSREGKAVNYLNLEVGDVITFSYDGRRTVSHIGIYIGNGKMVHAEGDGSMTLGQYENQCVKVSSVEKGSIYYQYIYNCRRLY